MFRKMEDSNKYPCHGCEKDKRACKYCKEWQECFRYEWYLMRVDFNKWLRGEKVE